MQSATEATSTAFVHRGLPGYMRAQLWTAAKGGGTGYKDAGHVFGSSIRHECPWAAEFAEWALEIDRVETFIDDDVAFSSWLRQTFPRILGRVPARRMDRFIAGVRDALT